MDSRFGDMSEYERRAWLRVQHELKKNHDRRSLIPAKVRELAEEAGDRIQNAWDRVPGSDTFDETLLKALVGLKSILFDPALGSVDEDKVLRAYQRSGFSVHEFSDLRKLDLKEIDGVTPGLGLAMPWSAPRRARWPVSLSPPRSL